MVNMVRNVLVLLCVFSSFASLGAQVLPFQFHVPDNSLARQKSRAIISASAPDLKRQKPVVFYDVLLEQPVRVDVRPGKDGTSSIWFVNKTGTAWKDEAAGNVELVRLTNSTELRSVRMFLNQDGSAQALIEKIGPDSVGITVRVLGGQFSPYRNIRIAIPLQSFVEMPVHRMMEITSRRIDWTAVIFYKDSSVFGPLVKVANTIQAALKGLPDSEDGAMDEDGNMVKIATLLPARDPGFNCSGFAKWLVDGFYGPLIKARNMELAPYLSIDLLKTRLLEYRGNERTLPWEEKRDPFFGLDWTRNLAIALAKTRGEQVGDFESRDIRSLLYSPYVEDKGYTLSDIPLVLYGEAIKNPGRWYLVSVNGEWGTTPPMWQHYHVVAVFPWFDQGGTFRLRLFERNVESTWASLEKRYPKTWGHLVWLESDGPFSPPVVPR